MSIRRSTTFMAIALLAACGTQPLEPEAETEAELMEQTAQLRAYPDTRVRLNGEVATGEGSAERVVTVRARSNRRGVQGTYRVELTGPGLFFEVDVTCLTRRDNVAWIAGHISDSNAEIIQIGSVSYFYVIDRGNGRYGEPDIVSTARINDVEGEDLLFCQDQRLLLPEAEAARGDMKLRPRAR